MTYAVVQTGFSYEAAQARFAGMSLRRAAEVLQQGNDPATVVRLTIQAVREVGPKRAEAMASAFGLDLHFQVHSH